MMCAHRTNFQKGTQNICEVCDSAWVLDTFGMMCGGLAVRPVKAQERVFVCQGCFDQITRRPKILKDATVWSYGY